MKRMFLRWYRNWTNPNPMPGQTWVLEGMGVVYVNHITFAVVPFDPRFVDFTCNGHHRRWTLSAFRSHAMAPMLSDLSRSEP